MKYSFFASASKTVKSVAFRSIFDKDQPPLKLLPYKIGRFYILFVFFA